MKKGQILEGTVERLDFPGQGIVTCGEGTCTVKNVLPGQKISFAVQKVRNGKAQGRLLQVLSPSPLEQESACPHFGRCGGCSYQTLPYERQLRLKEEQVSRLLTPVLDRQERKFDEIFEGILPSPSPYDYRNKMEFTFGDEVKDGPLALGMHQRGSFYDIVTVDRCRIADADFGRILRCVRDYFAELGTPFFHRLRHTGCLRHLLVRKASRTGEILIALVTTTQQEPDLQPLCRRLLALAEAPDPLEGRIVGILHMKNDAVADVVRSDETVTLYGQDFFYEELLGLRFRISAFSFFQTNSRGAEVLYQKVREYAALRAPSGVIYDLYSGTGTIAQMMAPVAERVVGVEIVAEAVEAARKNAADNGLDNCTFLTGDVLKVLDSLPEKPDLLILDPPREGIHPKALDKLLRYGTERIVYISCKPTSLARDLVVFLARGYRVERCACVDMFPGTGHVETIVGLRRQDM